MVAPNLVAKELTEGKPWEFLVAETPLRTMKKDKRRVLLLSEKTDWQVYSAVRGLAPNLRVSKTNPPVALLGLPVDYDSATPIEQAEAAVIAHFKGHEDQMPACMEKTLGGKIRLVWVFESPILTPSFEFCTALMETLLKKLGAPTLLAGYDAASAKPAEMWTNGGDWYFFGDGSTPPNALSKEFTFGVACDVSKKTALFNKGEIPLPTIAAEVQARFPGRWQGDFRADALGVRFWDNDADNPTGCQVKPDGMLCFTGNEPFKSWESIFSRQWCEEQKVLNLGRAGENIYFDGKNYWEFQAGRWECTARHDVILRLKGRGLSDRTPKDATQSDVERVLDHVQQLNRVVGAAPMINYPPGIVETDGRRVLNIADLKPVLPVKGATGTPEDFPFLWDFFNNFFARPELMPKDHLLAWLQRAYKCVIQHARHMGQAVFVCGPRNNGKTLLCMRIVRPLLGNRSANPINFITGETSFNSELFSSALLAVNDEDSPSSEAERKKMLMKLKGMVVNPMHTYHAKFEKPVTIDWTGRIFITLNDDPGSVGMLMEVEHNTRDKQMFFASKARSTPFPQQDELEATIARELPAFAWWLLNVYVPPAEVVSDDRMGVKSFFDPAILDLSHQQTFASNLTELLKLWIDSDSYWGDPETKLWNGTPTLLLSCLKTCEMTKGIASDWTQQMVAKSLTALAKQDGSGITSTTGESREFQISRNL